MSFSFSLKAKSRQAAIKAAAEEMAKIVAQQPAHENDRYHVMSTVAHYMSLLSEPKSGNDITLQVNGSVSLAHDGQPGSVTTDVVAINIGCNAWHSPASV